MIDMNVEIKLLKNGGVSQQAPKLKVNRKLMPRPFGPSPAEELLTGCIYYRII